MHRSRIAGFTLIELLIVIIIIGILAAIAIPAFNSTKGKAYSASLKTDLRNLATAEEAYFFQANVYTDNLSDLNFTKTQGVTITFGEATVSGWSATATRPLAIPATCALYVGNVTPVAPATTESQITCQ